MNYVSGGYSVASGSIGGCIAAGIATTALESLLVAASSSRDSATVASLSVETSTPANPATAAAHAIAALGRLARFTVRDWSSDGGDLATAAWDGAVGARRRFVRLVCASSPTSSSTSMLAATTIAYYCNTMGRYGFKNICLLAIADGHSE